MRIKINDKIYRLKEIESGVDSLMELVEEPQYKDGDFVYEDGRIMIFKSCPNNYHYIYYSLIGKNAFDDNYGIDFTAKSFRRATEEEKQTLLDELAKDGKRWNAEKKCVEDIPVRKFKKGDKVRIKEGVSSKTHKGERPGFASGMDDLIGRTMTIELYCDRDIVLCEKLHWQFKEDWLEPVEELKKGDLAIFWDENKEYAKIGIYLHRGVYHYDHSNTSWTHAIKFESKEQYEKLIKGKL